MLPALLEYIKKDQCVSIEQLSRAFHIDADALFPMLDKWVSKGTIQSYERTTCGRQCRSCQPRKLVYYQYK